MPIYSVFFRFFAIIRCEYNFLDSSSNNFFKKCHIYRVLMYDFYVYIGKLLAKVGYMGLKKCHQLKSILYTGPRDLYQDMANIKNFAQRPGKVVMGPRQPKYGKKTGFLRVLGSPHFIRRFLQFSHFSANIIHFKQSVGTQDAYLFGLFQVFCNYQM